MSARVVVTGEVVSLHESSQADGSWTLGTVRPSSGAADVVFVATDLPPCLVGSTARLGGFYEPRPGGAPGERQLRVVDLESDLPASADAVVRYLRANLRGCRLGAKGAQRIVTVLGASCLERLELDPSLVRPLFPGATGLAIEHAVRLWAAESRRDTKAKQLTIKLLDAGVRYATVRKITGHFRSAEAAEVCTLRHPYRLLEVPGIGFATADAIARLLGADPRDPRRYEAACRHVLRDALREGHTGLPDAEVARRVADAKVLGCDEADPEIGAAIARLVAVDRVVRVGALLCDPAAWDDEWGVAEPVSRLLAVPRALPPAERAVVETLLAESVLTDTQKGAVRMALSHGVSLLTGRPGSGKTTTLKTYIACCRALGWSVQVVAPTGKAASRAAEVTGASASTVHRLLGGARSAVTPTLKARVLVVDEGGMCDAETAAWLLSAVDPLRTSVLWTGDADQLPSVGAGQVLHDLVVSGRVPVTALTQIHRQGAGSRIIDAANALLDGEPLDLASGGDWRFTEVHDGEPATRGCEHLVTAVRTLVAGGVDPLEELQVLVPMRRGPVGVNTINTLLQDELNAHGARGPKIGGGAVVRLGDRVVMTRNAYDLERPLYNGEQAVVVGVDAARQSVTLRVDDARPALEVRGLQRLMLHLAWAVTVHRSQGSEYPHAILLYDHRAHAPMLLRGVLYTAITRAKRCFHLIGTREAVRRTQMPGADARRYTALVEHIRNALGEDC